MLRRMQDEQPKKADDQGLAAIYETFNSRPVGRDSTIKNGGAMNGNCILHVAQNLSEINGGYCGGKYRRALSILLMCLELQDHRNYVQILRTIKILIKRQRGLMGVRVRV